MPTAPRLEYRSALAAALGPPAAIGDTPHDHRLVVPAPGGIVEGPHLQGQVLPVGGNWLLIRPDGLRGGCDWLQIGPDGAPG